MMMIVMIMTIMMSMLMMVMAMMTTTTTMMMVMTLTSRSLRTSMSLTGRQTEVLQNITCVFSSFSLQSRSWRLVPSVYYNEDGDENYLVIRGV